MQTRCRESFLTVTAILAAGCLELACEPGLGVDEGALALEPRVLKSAIEIADPHRARFPENTVLHGFGRSIWDLHTFDGRIYIGGGDSWNNTGPTAVWSLGDDGVSTDVRLEIVVDDEQVNLFREYEGRLFIPGSDATESWEFGNYYVKSGGVWQKRRTIPGGLHVYDIAPFAGRLYAYAVTAHGLGLFESSDDGGSWRLSSRRGGGMLAPLDDVLMIMGNCWEKGCVTLGPGPAKTFRVPVPTLSGARTARLGKGVLYADTVFNLPDLDYRSPLYYLGAPRGPYLTEDLAESGVRDVIVEGETAYVLTAARHPTQAGTYLSHVFSSTDLAQWTRVAEFTVPAPPYSLARLGGRLYVGLGADRLYDDPAAVPQLKSGTIWRLE